MLIQRGQQIAGMEAVDARSLMRSMRNCALSPGRIAHVMGTSTQEAVDRLAELAAVGLVEVSIDAGSRWRAEEEDDAVKYWTATLKGRALAKARLGKPVRRSKAEDVFRAFLGRVEDANNDADELFWVESVELFGSFADPGRHTVGDVDLRVVLSRRDAGDTRLRRVAEAVAAGRAAGRKFRSHLDEMAAATTRAAPARADLPSRHPVRQRGLSAPPPCESDRRRGLPTSRSPADGAIHLIASGAATASGRRLLPTPPVTRRAS